MARVFVRSPVNGRPIGRGTVVRLLASRAHSMVGVIGIVERVFRARVDTADHVASVIFPSPTGKAIALRGRDSSHGGKIIDPSTGKTKCTQYAISVRYLEPIGEVKRVPECGPGGHWVRPSNRKHRVRDAEIGREVDALRRELALHPLGEDWEHSRRRAQIANRLVILDRKLERLPVGLRRKHR